MLGTARDSYSSEKYLCLAYSIIRQKVGQHTLQRFLAKNVKTPRISHLSSSEDVISPVARIRSQYRSYVYGAPTLGAGKHYLGVFHI